MPMFVWQQGACVGGGGGRERKEEGERIEGGRENVQEGFKQSYVHLPGCVCMSGIKKMNVFVNMCVRNCTLICEQALFQ